MTKHRVLAIIIILISILAGYFVYSSQFRANSQYKFKLGLDLSGGTHLVYAADISHLNSGDVDSAMSALRDVIERRVNLFGVSEPLVQLENTGALGGNQQELIVELPGVTDINSAIAIIGQTPVLDFKLLNDAVAAQTAKVQASTTSSATTSPANLFIDTGLTGRLLDNAQLQFDPQTGEPQVELIFNSEGQALFAKITRENVGHVLAIFLDGKEISSPVIREEIADGKAQISGNFTATEAQLLVRDLNYGALPVPINLIGTQKIGASLGETALHQGLQAGILAFIIIALFLILWYRLPGFLAVISLSIYVIIMLFLFKIIPVVLTSAGLAGFILSIGMAVDANILIFERMKEEFRKGLDIHAGIHEGFHRAWTSIRDGNLSSIITAIVLFELSSTPLIRGFALIFGIGVLVSMLTAISISRTFLLAISPRNEKKELASIKNSRTQKFLFNNGFNFKKN
jgi:protein-export membrane protein SecD